MTKYCTVFCVNIIILWIYILLYHIYMFYVFYICFVLAGLSTCSPCTFLLSLNFRATNIQNHIPAKQCQKTTHTKYEWSTSTSLFLLGTVTEHALMCTQWRISHWRCFDVNSGETNLPSFSLSGQASAVSAAQGFMMVECSVGSFRSYTGMRRWPWRIAWTLECTCCWTGRGWVSRCSENRNEGRDVGYGDISNLVLKKTGLVGGRL